jgi:hypothetical protein
VTARYTEVEGASTEVEDECETRGHIGGSRSSHGLFHESDLLQAG